VPAWCGISKMNVVARLLTGQTKHVLGRGRGAELEAGLRAHGSAVCCLWRKSHNSDGSWRIFDLTGLLRDNFDSGGDF
jgi:hypothetical protein